MFVGEDIGFEKEGGRIGEGFSSFEAECVVVGTVSSKISKIL